MRHFTHPITEKASTMNREPRWPVGTDWPLWLLVTLLIFGLSLMGCGLLGFLIGLL